MGTLAEPFRVLIVDDDDLVLRSLARFVDAPCDACGSAAEARAALDTTSYDAILLDIHLPDGSGLELLELVRSTSETPVLVLTADERVAHANRAQLLGAEIAYKPEVTANVRAFIGRARAQAQAQAAGRLEERAVAAGLSRREMDVLRLVAAGRTRVSAAAELGIGVATVKTLVRRLLDRTGSPSVQDLLREWHPAGSSGTRRRPGLEADEEVPAQGRGRR